MPGCRKHWPAAWLSLVSTGAVGGSSQHGSGRKCLLHSFKNAHSETIAVPGTGDLLTETHIVIYFLELSKGFSLTGQIFLKERTTENIVIKLMAILWDEQNLTQC